jgi:hypothetical protein
MALNFNNQTDELVSDSGVIRLKNTDLYLSDGRGIQISTVGTQSKAGQGVLVGGSATIATTAIAASSLIFLTQYQSGSPLSILGSLRIGTITAGVGFTVSSSNILDTSKFNWMIVQPFLGT